MSRYLVVAPQGIGDSLEATPFLAALKHAQPQASIDVAVMRRGPKELFEGLPEIVNEVVYLPYWDAGAMPFVRELLRKRRRPRYDASFLMYPAARREYQLLMRAFSSRRRYAHRYFDSNFSSLQWMNTDLVDVLDRRHNVLQNLELLRAAGVAHDIPDRYVVPQKWVVDASQRDPKRIAIHVGTITHDGLAARRWPTDRFAEIARRCVTLGFEVYLIMGPSERDETLAVKAAVPDVRIAEGSLCDIARFLSTCRLLLSNDSGIAHLGAGVGTEVIALFGPTAPWRHAPYAPDAHALRPSDCPPCFDPRYLNTGCALHIDYKCLKRDLSVEIVDSALMRVLSGSSAEMECR